MRGTSVGKAVFYINGTSVLVEVERYYGGNDVLPKINTDGQGKPLYMFLIDGRTNYKLFSTAQTAKNAAERIARKELV